MMISTKGRYALRVVIDLAEHFTGCYIPLKDVAVRQEISQKYLESIMADLSKTGFLEGLHGKGGGYKLKKAPEDITVLDILEQTEGSLAPITCLDPSSLPCNMSSECRTLPMWSKLNDIIRDYFKGITIADLMKNNVVTDNYVI